MVDKRVPCRFCIHFSLLLEKIPNVEEDGWCSEKKRFRNSNSESCDEFEPRTVDPLIKYSPKRPMGIPRSQNVFRGIDATKLVSVPEYLKKVFTGWYK